MSILDLTLLAMSCVLHTPAADTCLHQASHTYESPSPVAGQNVASPQFTGGAVDVVLTAQAAYAWDVASGTTLYAKQADSSRPVASITKLLSALTAVEHLASDTEVTISTTAAGRARQGANVKLPAGHQVAVGELLAASLIASANDAMVALAEAVSGSEAAFVTVLNQHAKQSGLLNTQASNATGLSTPASPTVTEQFSTAREVSTLMTLAYNHPTLRPLLSAPHGILRTAQGATRSYESTNKLLQTYVPVQAAKTGYTAEAGQNLVIISEGAAGQQIGAVILGSEQRFQDMKILLEWVGRNYSW